VQRKGPRQRHREPILDGGCSGFELAKEIGWHINAAVPQQERRGRRSAGHVTVGGGNSHTLKDDNNNEDTPGVAKEAPAAVFELVILQVQLQQGGSIMRWEPHKSLSSSTAKSLRSCCVFDVTMLVVLYW